MGTRLIKSIKQLKFNSSNLQAYKVSPQSLSAKGLKGKTARLKITIETNVDHLRLALVEHYTNNDFNALSKIDTVELMRKNPVVITEYALEQNYPNPFNPTTTIRYQLPNAGHITLKVYDMLGREVATLVDGAKEIGSYSVTFDGGKLASGVYILRLIAESEEGRLFVKVRKLVLMK